MDGGSWLGCDGVGEDLVIAFLFRQRVRGFGATVWVDDWWIWCNGSDGGL